MVTEGGEGKFLVLRKKGGVPWDKRGQKGKKKEEYI
jgi:hypothetical protein